MQKITRDTIIKVGDIVDLEGYKREVLAIVDRAIIFDYRSHYGSQIDTLEGLVVGNYSLVIPEWKASELKEGEGYWYLDSLGDQSTSTWESHPKHRFRLKSNNIYRTEEDANQAYKKIIGEKELLKILKKKT